MPAKLNIIIGAEMLLPGRQARAQPGFILLRRGEFADTGDEGIGHRRETQIALDGAAEFQGRFIKTGCAHFLQVFPRKISHHRIGQANTGFGDPTRIGLAAGDGSNMARIGSQHTPNLFLNAKR